jgi:threonine dehydrogenase-like Zn-dependent dehydrogenase
VRGLVFSLSIPKYVVAKAVGGRFPSVHYGRGSCLSLREVPDPKPPGPDWMELKPRLAGLCGSDMGTIFFKSSPVLEPFNSFPAVLGHEILAQVPEGGERRGSVEPGQRVVVNPLLPCRLRAVEKPCAPCTGGQENGCEMSAEGHLAPGMMLGYHRDLPGAMGERMVAHPSQLYPVPEAISDEVAVLVEPLSVCLHAVLKNPPRAEDRVLIIGGGPVAFGTLWAIRALGHRCHVTLLTTEAYQLELAKAMGADEVMRAARDDFQEAEAVAKLTGARVYKPVIGPPAMTGGFEQVFDCVGSQASVQDALRYARSLGRVVLLGAAGALERVDWTTVWKNELTIAGSYTYGMEVFRGRALHTFQVVLDLLREREGPDPRPLVTHVFKLSGYGQAIETNLFRGKHKSVKAVFDLRGGAA